LTNYLEIHPCTEPYQKEDPDFEFCVAYYFGISLPRETNVRELDLKYATIEFMEKVRQKKAEIGESCNVKIYQITRDELPDCVFEGLRPEWAKKKRARGISQTSITTSGEEPFPGKKVHGNPGIDAEVNIYAKFSGQTVEMTEPSNGITDFSIEMHKANSQALSDNSTDSSVISPNKKITHVSGKGINDVLPQFIPEVKPILPSMKTGIDMKVVQKPIVEEKKKMLNIINENKDLVVNKEKVMDALDDYL